MAAYNMWLHATALALLRAEKAIRLLFMRFWESNEAFEAHCQRKEIGDFFQLQCVDETGLVEKSNVAIYTDEPNNFDAPKF